MTGEFTGERRFLVEFLLSRGITDKRLLKAMATVKRHRFIPSEHLQGCDPYGDHPCPIGYGQTISQPFVTALMIEKLGLENGARVLEIGTGSGYQTEVLHEMGMDVFTIEIIPELFRHADKLLNSSIRRKLSNGYLGWPEMAPFSGIILSCAPASIPEVLKLQLTPNGRMVLPVGSVFQRLIVVNRSTDGFSVCPGIPVSFVPMTGERSGKT